MQGLPFKLLKANVSVDRGVLWRVDHGAKQGEKS